MKALLIYMMLVCGLRILTHAIYLNTNKYPHTMYEVKSSAQELFFLLTDAAVMAWVIYLFRTNYCE